LDRIDRGNFKTVFKDSPLKEPGFEALEGMSILLSKE
jgi:hypothetical protein